MFEERKGGKFELRFLVPQAARSEKDEEVIKKRLKNFFKNNEREIKKELNKTIRNGVLLTILGFFFMILATFIAYLGLESLMSKFIVIVIDPASWFLLWYGLDEIFYNAKKIRKNYQFYKKVSNTEVAFLPY